MITLKPIETQYNGFRFRSRLEARWAVFFDSMSVKYLYEPEGFELGDGLRYLPDFYLPHLDIWVEIKPGDAPNIWGHMATQFTEETSRPLELASRLAMGTKQNVLILYGQPTYPAIDWVNMEQEKAYSGIMCFGVFNSLTLHRDSWIVRDTFESLFPFLNSKGFDAPEFDDTIECARQLVELDKQFYMREYGVEHPKWAYGITQNNMRWFYDNKQLYPAVDFDATYRPGVAVVDSLMAAQSARFEHGDNPKVSRVNFDSIPF